MLSRNNIRFCHENSTESPVTLFCNNNQDVYIIFVTSLYHYSPQPN